MIFLEKNYVKFNAHYNSRTKLHLSMKRKESSEEIGYKETEVSNAIQILSLDKYIRKYVLSFG